MLKTEVAFGKNVTFVFYENHSHFVYNFMLYRRYNSIQIKDMLFWYSKIGKQRENVHSDIFSIKILKLNLGGLLCCMD